jgi:integrase
MKLTKDMVATLALPPGKTDQFYWDDELPRFGRRVRLGADGKPQHSWIIQWKVGRTTKRLRVGSDALDPKAARTLARKLLGRVEQGEDPSADKRKRREQDERTMARLVGLYLADKKGKWAGKTRMEFERYLTDDRYFRPLHRLPIDRIELGDIAPCIDAIKIIGAPTAARARSALSAFFVWCMKRGLCPANPVIGTDNPQTAARDRVLTEDEIAAIWRACNGADDYSRIIKLLVLTACRRQEVGGLRFDECDFDRGTWAIPKERTKTGVARTIPILPMMREILDGVPRNREWLFGERASGFTLWSKAKLALDERCGFKDWVVHDIRRTCSTIMNEELEIEPHIVELLLGHEFRSGTHGTYNKAKYKRAIAAAYALWHDYLRTLIDGGERKVVHLSMA